MSKLIQRALLTVALMTPVGATFAATKIATIDMREVFQQLPQREVVMKKLQQDFAGRVKELEGLQSNIKALYQKRQKNKGLMSDAEQTQLNRKLEELQTEFQLKRKNYEDDRRQESQQEQQKLIDKIQKAVATIAKQKNLDLVLPTDATAYAKPGMDISKQVIDAVSKEK
ncbi:OmpH family outer membrane protein [Celerinatantimonas yamalensis]|uniref:OmpH family outer membrane protein n=1 Tax=Celerinatantimonas yamalensis TaxID=559956 RepID=A0ABW9G8K0_9GAMM